LKAIRPPRYETRVISETDTGIYNEKKELIAVHHKVDDTYQWTTKDMEEAVPFPHSPDLKPMTTDEEDKLASSVGCTMNPVKDRTVLPYRCIGKIFTKFSTNDRDWKYVATGWVNSLNSIVTAAHVVYDRRAQRWVDSLIFIPAYHKGQAPYGVWR
jgi:hypothetical protein